jgi:hypothetical protein
MRKLFAAALAMAVLSACAPASPDYLAPVESYLIENIGEASFGGKVFCAYDVLGADLRAERADVYVWALCAEYHLEGGALTMGTAGSLPVALTMQKSNGQYTVTGHAVPGNGTDYWPSILRIFPAGAVENMCEGKIDCYNERAARLENAVEEQARGYYGLK